MGHTAGADWQQASGSLSQPDRWPLPCTGWLLLSWEYVLHIQDLRYFPPSKLSFSFLLCTQYLSGPPCYLLQEALLTLGASSRASPWTANPLMMCILIFLPPPLKEG